MYLVALSGGADSVCLLLTLLSQGKVGAAAHCNFHLRGDESLRDEAFVRQLCAEKGVKLYVANFDTLTEAQQTGESIEMAARRLRYEWFKQLIAQHGFEGVAVGHHQEDNAETILLNMVRGTGLQGLQGMQPLSNKQGFCIYRPLLAYTKADILNYLRKQQQTFVTDSTNTDTHYRRNKMRHCVLPLLQTMNPQVVNALNQMAHNLAEVDKVYRVGLQQLCESCGLQAVPHHSAYKQVLRQQLLQMPQRETLLRELLTPYAFTPSQVADALQMRVGGVLTTDQGMLTATEEHYQFGPLPPSLPNTLVPMPTEHHPQVVALADGSRLTVVSLQRSELRSLKCAPNEMLVDASALRGTLMLRGMVTGDRFSPFGMKGTQLVSDYMTNHHCSRIEKLTTWLLTDSEGVLWIVGHRADSRTRLTAQTTQVLHFKIEDN